jgi:hypothetical protein
MKNKSKRGGPGRNQGLKKGTKHKNALKDKADRRSERKMVCFTPSEEERNRRAMKAVNVSVFNQFGRDAIMESVNAILCKENIMENKKFQEVLSLVNHYYSLPNNCAGGNLHIVVDDGNVEDDDIEYCKEQADRKGDKEGVAIAKLLIKMSKKDREKIYMESGASIESDMLSLGSLPVEEALKIIDSYESLGWTVEYVGSGRIMITRKRP